MKSRFSDEEGSVHLRDKEHFIADVREVTFQPRDGLAMLFAAVNAVNADFGPVWLVPSHEFRQHGLRTGNGKLRFSASAKENFCGQWSTYRLTKQQLAPALLRRLAEL